MFDAGQLGVAGQADATDSQAHAFAGMGLGPDRGRRPEGEPAPDGSGLGPVAAPATAAGENEFDHAIAVALRQTCHIFQPLRRPRWHQTQTTATLLQARQVKIPQAGPAITQGQGLEQAVAIVQAAVVQRQAVTPLTVDQCLAHTPSALIKPRALARVSSSSRWATESATRPAPARNHRRRPCCCRVRMRILRSMSPLWFR